jgi:cytochrome c oxidase subunit 3
MFYYGITGLHGLHVLVGALIIIGVMIFLTKKKVIEAVENAGLYWHFVDLVWLYIFPLFYLT